MTHRTYLEQIVPADILQALRDAGYRIMAPSPHGTATRYQAGCRCEDCTIANRLRCYQCFTDMRARGLAPDDPRHGTLNAYSNWGCRCEPCTEANKKRCKEYQEYKKAQR